MWRRQRLAAHGRELTITEMVLSINLLFVRKWREHVKRYLRAVVRNVAVEKLVFSLIELDAEVEGDNVCNNSARLLSITEQRAERYHLH
jgi:hypothetical protein